MQLRVCSVIWTLLKLLGTSYSCRAQWEDALCTRIITLACMFWSFFPLIICNIIWPLYPDIFSLLTNTVRVYQISIAYWIFFHCILSICDFWLFPKLVFWERDLPSDCSSPCSLLSHYLIYISSTLQIGLFALNRTFVKCIFGLFMICFYIWAATWKTCLRAFRPGPTQTGLGNHRR